MANDTEDHEPEDPEPEPDEHPDRRSREQARRAARRQRMRIVGSVLIIAIVALVSLVATDTLRVGGSGPLLASGNSKVTTPTTVDAQPQVKRLKQDTPPRPLTNEAPLRLWVGGDSLSGALGYQLGPMLTKLGIVKTHVDYRVSSGLASNGVRDWPERFEQQEPEYEPEAIVFMVGANDASIVGSAVDAVGAPAWEADYRARVDEMMDLFVGGPAQRTVFWISSPTLGTRYDRGARELGRVMREEAAKRPTVVFVDAYALFSENGEYSSSLTDSDGDRVQMRIGDGVHFTVAGAEYLAEHVYRLLNSRWNLAAQASPETPIQYTISPSGGTIGGVNQGNGWSGSTTTTPSPVASPTTTPTTTSPTTTPPTSTPPTAAPTTTTG